MQTATDTLDPENIGQKLEVLKSSISAIRAAEQELIKNRAERMGVVRRETMQREETGVEKHNRRVQQLAQERHQAVEREAVRKVQHAERIQTAFHTSRAALANRAQGVKDRRIGRVQGEIMRNRQERQEELKQATEAHQAFQQQLAADCAQRRGLRKSAILTFRSYVPILGKRLIGEIRKSPAPQPAATAEETRALLVEKLREIEAMLGAANKLVLAKVFRFVPLWLLAVLLPLLHFQTVMRDGVSAIPWGTIAISEGILFAIWGLSLILALPSVRKLSEALYAAKSLEHAASKQSAARVAALADEIKTEADEEGQSLSETFRESDSEWKTRIRAGQQKLDAQVARLPAILEKLHRRRLAAIDAAHERAIVQAQGEAVERTRLVEASRSQVNTSIGADVDGRITELTKSWADEVMPLFESLVSLDKESIEKFPAWSREVCETWTPPEEAVAALRIGRIEVNPEILAEGMPHDARLTLPARETFSVPFALGFPDHGSVMIESDGTGDAATRALQASSLRLLAAFPPGRASFVFIDPVGLGKDFAGLMHLADYEETLIHHRIWTQSTQIEERLAELNDHIEKVIQMYLRNEYADITQYNEQAGTIAEKYSFLVIAGFPAGFSETAAKRLLSIAASGARCGVHLLIQRDLRQPSPEPALDDELRRSCLRVLLKDGQFRLTDAPPGADRVVFDAPPADEDAITLVNRIGKASIDSNRVQVPFEHIAPPVDERWSFDTTEELRVPIGRTGARKLQMLAIGKGTRQHALVAGKTGSGKSTLFHVIITNLALWCDPEQVEFYLVDFKKGVEFKCYAAKQLPHARVIAIESDREFALSVLRRVDAELRRRGELFRHAGSQDMAGYKRTPGHEPLPRSLLLIDEFQEFFTEDDTVAQEASLLLDRIVRQGRAFGIHVILGSQTLGGAYTLARATLGQMVIRVALQCNEADAHLIMDDDNPAPRMLTRPGEGIYNDQAGALAANSPFQIVWLPEAERDAMLDEVNRLARRDGKSPAVPIVFEGNAPADVRDNVELRKFLLNPPVNRPLTARAWLGAPNSIKGPTEAEFQRQSGSNLLIVGQSAERSMALLLIGIASLAAQYPVGMVRFVILDPHDHDTGADGAFRKLAAVLPHDIQVGGPAEVAGLLGNLAAELEGRGPTSGRDAAEVFLIVHDLQRFKALRPDDEFRFSMDDDAGAAAAPSQVFANLLGEGGPVGMHVLAATDSWNNVSRWIPRKLMAEFEMRVLFQMSANDSANLIDSPAASSLGLHRALFHNEHHATMETFRPYALPDDAWLEEMARSV
ncbi:MAG: FtsK/SpoIIIE domain-containing protein [Verrucomicrobiota bacterium]